jgi:GH15 family glucan-1,4-alpha-glucosidase
MDTVVSTGNRASSSRIDGYAPVRDYAAIGDGRTVALVARDGSIDWLCLPNLDSPSVFGALLDPGRGGRFVVSPDGSFEVERRYVRDTNVLETTFHTADGTVRLTDALTLPLGGVAPVREIVRRVEGISGEVGMHWCFEPRFEYGASAPNMGRRHGAVVATGGRDALALRAWDAGDMRVDDEGAGARFVARSGSRALLVLSCAVHEPLVLPGRGDAERRLDATAGFWRRWAGERTYDGPWRDAVIRSGLVLKQLAYAPSGAIAAAATTSVPEAIGGGRNWDYRFSWVRDASFTVEALLALGSDEEAHTFLWWLLQASQRMHPRLQVLYRLDGGTRVRETELPLPGYRGSRPVRIGNGAVDQLQLGIYGEVLDATHRHVQAHGPLDRDVGRRIAELATHVCSLWQEPDCGIWEVRSDPRHFTHSKILCWVALDRALGLAQHAIPATQAPIWRKAAAEIRSFVERRCWSDDLGSYVRAPGLEEMDASLLLAGTVGFTDPRGTRAQGTIDAVRRVLASGPLVRRYAGADGLEGEEGAFLACSFWLVDALAHAGRLDDAAELMDQLVGLANDVGLFAEEIDPSTGAFLGNMPQGLTHLALINAAASIATEAA